MALKKFKPTTSSLRFRETSDFAEVTKEKPERSLVGANAGSGGRNVHGHMTVRSRGGGHKRKYRVVDFRRDKLGAPGRVAAIEYDPNRSARIALIHYVDGEKRYIIHPAGLRVGDTVRAGPGSEVKVGNALPLTEIPLGTFVHNIELKPGRGGQMARSAGTYAQIMAKEEGFAHLRLPSGEIRLVHLECTATVGQVGNVEHENVSSGKAGRSRWLGRRPRVRGVAMNPVDHPHGGGEGKAPQGNPHPVSPWGQPTKGYKTRKKNKPSDKYIVRRRK